MRIEFASATDIYIFIVFFVVFKGKGEADTDLRLLPIATNTHINRYYNVKITQVLLYNTLLDMIKTKTILSV